MSKTAFLRSTNLVRKEDIAMAHGFIPRGISAAIPAQPQYTPASEGICFGADESIGPETVKDSQDQAYKASTDVVSGYIYLNVQQRDGKLGVTVNHARKKHSPS